MSNWAFKNMNSRSSSWAWRTSKRRSNWAFSRSRNSSFWAFSTPKKKGTYAKHWGFEPERDRVMHRERKKPRFWIW